MLCWPFYKERLHRCTQEVLSLEAERTLDVVQLFSWP